MSIVTNVSRCYQKQESYVTVGPTKLKCILTRVLIS